MVHAAGKAHPKKIKAEVLPAKEHKDEIVKHELGSHGAVCYGPDGEVLWKLAGHTMSQKIIDDAVTEILGKL